MAAIMVGASVLGGVASGIADYRDGNKLRKSICSMDQSILSVTQNYNALLQQESNDIDTLQSNLQNSMDNLAVEKETLKVLRENYAKSKNQMVIASIIFVVTITISFLFKKLGFFDLIYESIFGK